MAHSVEARYPFLDPDVIDFSNRLPPRHKIHGLNEKAVLKKAMKGLLPESVLKRSKQPYMAPDSDSFFRGNIGMEVVGKYLSEDSLRNVGLFDAMKVEHLLAKCEKGRVIGFKDNMSFMGILTAQIFHDLFLVGFDRHIPSEIDPPTLRIFR
jgi:asparagine synthase (glutamine-hydrolysing)